MEELTLDRILEECMCMRELLIRLGFGSREITLAMPDDHKHIGIALMTQGRLIALEVSKNHQPWTKKEIEQAWVQKIRRFMEGEPSDEAFYQICQNSMAFKKSMSIVEELLKAGLTIPKLPKNRSNPTVWGQA